MNQKNFIVVIILLLVGGIALTVSNTEKKFEVDDNNADSTAVEIETIERFNENSVSIEEQSSTVNWTKQDLRQNYIVNSVSYDLLFTSPRDNENNYHRFELSLNTHSVDLDSLKIEESIYFIDSLDNIYEPKIIFEKEGNGHHISYSIEVAKKDLVINILEEISTISLVIETLGEDIVFSWPIEMFN